MTQHKATTPREPGIGDAIDVHIGRRLHGLRVARGLSLAEVAAKVDMSFQQIQKYESGRSRMSAAKLCALASALDMPVSFFFDDCALAGSGNDNTPKDLTQEAWLLASQFDRITNPKTRARVLELVKCLAEEA